MEYAIIFLPLFGSILAGFFSKYIGQRNSEFVTSFLVLVSALLALIIFKDVIINGLFFISEDVLLFLNY